MRTDTVCEGIHMVKIDQVKARKGQGKNSHPGGLALHFAMQPLLGHQLQQLLILFLEQMDLLSVRIKEAWRKYDSNCQQLL